MIHAIIAINRPRGMYVARPQEGDEHVLFELLEHEALGLGDLIDIARPDSPGSQHCRDLTSGRVVEIYIQNHGGPQMVRHWLQ